MTSALDEKWRPFNFYFSRVGLRTYQHPCMYSTAMLRTDNLILYIPLANLFG